MTDIHATRVEPNVLRGCEIWATAAEGGWTMRAEGLVAVGCDAGQRAFNQMFITAPDVDAAALRAVASTYEHGRFRLRFRAELHESSLPAIEANGFVRQGGIPTMTMPVTGPLPTADTDLRIERVTDPKTLTDHVYVVTQGFDWKPDTLGRIMTPKLLDEPDWTGWVGYLDGEPVASSQVVVHGNVAGLYYVATVEAARRKGYGEAITRAAMQEGIARGCDMFSLQASPSGRPVYERIGFTVTGEYITYVTKEVTNG